MNDPSEARAHVESEPKSFAEMQEWVREQLEIEGVAAEVVRLDDARALNRRLRKEIDQLRHRIDCMTVVLRALLLDFRTQSKPSPEPPSGQGDDIEPARRDLLVSWLDRHELRVGLSLEVGHEFTPRPEEQGCVDVECAARTAHCRAVCCRIPFVLSAQEVAEGKARWDANNPFHLEAGADGYCVHLDRETFRCTIHSSRPGACRAFSCRQDQRIWLDFDRKEIPPALAHFLSARTSHAPDPVGRAASADALSRADRKTVDRGRTFR